MAQWEREVYALPGDIESMSYERTFTRPLGINLATGSAPERIVVRKLMPIMVVACFPWSVPDRNIDRGAIVLVPHQGLWWWKWV